MIDEELLFRIEGEISGLDESSLTPAQRTFLLVWSLEAGVNNGGFNQYFFNQSGRHAPHVAAALIEIGAHECARMVASALAAVDTGTLDWNDETARQNFFADPAKEVEVRLDAIDQEFYEYPDDLSALLAAFVKARPDDFGCNG